MSPRVPRNPESLEGQAPPEPGAEGEAPELEPVAEETAADTFDGRVGTLPPGSSFQLHGQEYTLTRVDGEIAHVVLMTTERVGATATTTKEIKYGVSREEIDASTEVARLSE